MVPRLLRVTLYVCPGWRVGELRTVPESAVTVCGALSLLTHVTIVPTFTKAAAGLNEKFCISIVTVVGAGAGVAGISLAVDVPAPKLFRSYVVGAVAGAPWWAKAP